MRFRLGILAVVAVVAATSTWCALGPAPRPSIAVRFEYDGNGSADAVRIADGITIEITRRLAQLDGLDVRSAAHASHYRDRRPDTGAFAIERGAALVVEGLVLSDADTVRHIHASLIRAKDGSVLWSESFAPENNDILAVNGAIAAAVADALELRFHSDQHPYSAPAALHTLYLRARALQADGGSVSRPEAIDVFERITRQDSSFIPAFAALATTLGGHLSVSGWLPLDPRMDAAARTAYEADPRLAEANLAMGLLSARTCQWTDADRYFAEALRLDPGAAPTYTDYVISMLLPLGRTTEALDVLRKAMAADPFSADIRRALAYLQLQTHDYKGALETSAWVIKHFPESEFADQSRGRALYLSGRIDEALEWFGSRDGQWGHRGYALALEGRQEEARALAESHPNEPARQLLIYAGLHDAERALDALRRTALDNPWRALVWAGWPEIEPVLRGDLRADAIRAQLLQCVRSEPNRSLGE